MGNDRWQRASALFQEALEHPLEQRAAFLREACGEDLQLRRAIASLLEADQEAGDYMEEPLVRILGKNSKFR